MQSGTTWNSKYAYMNQPSAIGSTVARFDLGANYTLDSTDTYYFYHYDEAGNVILITDKNGNVLDHFEQDAWGNDLNSTFNTARAISQHQTSKFYDTTTGLYFFGARWYYPEIGRFISVSPLAPTGEEEYVYCGCNPIGYSDIDGEELENIVDTIDKHWRSNVIGVDVIRGIDLSTAKNLTNGLMDTLEDFYSGPSLLGFLPTAIAGLFELPNRVIVKEDGVTISHKYPRDHAPAHLHVECEGKIVHIGQNGYPLKGQQALTPKMESVIQKYRNRIRKVLKNIMRWHRLSPKG